MNQNEPKYFPLWRTISGKSEGGAKSQSRTPMPHGRMEFWGVTAKMKHKNEAQKVRYNQQKVQKQLRVCKIVLSISQTRHKMHVFRKSWKKNRDRDDGISTIFFDVPNLSGFRQEKGSTRLSTKWTHGFLLCTIKNGGSDSKKIGENMDGWIFCLWHQNEA